MKATTILNVDDNDINRYIRTQTLLSAGYRVVEAATGKQAFERMQSDRPQLVLLDMNLPDMHGVEVCRHIKTQADARSVIVVHISATQTTVEDRIFGLEGGADGYLTEPVEPDLLLATVRSMLRLGELQLQLEESLAATRNMAAKYQSLVEAVPHIIFTSTAAGEWTYLSEQFSTYTNLGTEEALGRGWIELVHPLDRESTLALWSHSLTTANPFDVECRLRYKDGSYRWNVMSARPVRDGGLIVQWVGSATDAHERKVLEEEVQFRHREFVALAEHSPDIIARLDLELRHTYINSTVLSVPSITPEEYIGKRIRELSFAPALRDQFEEACHRVLASGQLHQFQFSQDLHGNTRYYGARIVPEFAQSGVAESLLMIISDITDRRNAEIAVADSERKLRRLVESNVIGVVISDGERITFANDVFLHTVGYTREDLQAGILKWNEMTPPEYQALDDKSMADLRERGAASTFEKEYWRKDGSRVPILIGAAALNQNASELVCFVLDTTELKNAEAALRKTNLALQRSNEDLEQFAYAASHDLQEPLRTVSIYTELLARHLGPDLAPTGAKFISIIQDAAKRMLKLINDLLAFSHAQSAELSSGQLIPAGDIVAEAVKDLNNAIDESGARVSFADLPAICVDGAEFTHVFQNLIGNSIKYRTPDQSPTIHITAERQGENWLFAVRDNGIGFDQAHAERIFGHFKRLHGPDIPGTGIGLAIVKRIIERHDGQVWAESRPGIGATFYFRLPIAATRHDPNAVPPYDSLPRTP